jgi:hypothetical protein
MVNRFTTLRSTISPRLTFQSALVSQYDPSEDIEPPKPFRRFPKASPYYAKLPSHNLFFIEPDFSHLKSLEAIARAYYPPLWHFPAIHQEKSIKFYRDVLLEIKSKQINPIKCQREANKVIFPLFPSKALRIEESSIVTMTTLKPGTKFCCTRMRLKPTPGLLILTKTLKGQFLYGFIGGGKYMVQSMRSSLRKSKK